MFIILSHYMNKQKILTILNDMKPHWELAEWMIALIEAGFMDKETYQNMLFMISAAIKQMPEWAEKDRLKDELEEIKKTDNKEDSQKDEQ